MFRNPRPNESDKDTIANLTCVVGSDSPGELLENILEELRLPVRVAIGIYPIFQKHFRLNNEP